ncbi:HMA5 [Symbiodinium microadriaticum]|nr:HMA5 [Symbiodinium microadriaticum]
MVGTSVGAANGILIKGGPPFEIAHKVDTVIFDKTGTLTEGKPAVTDELVLTEATVVTSASAEEVEQRNHMLRLAALAEQCSEHPLAGAILHAAVKRGLTPIDNTLAEYGMHTGGVSCTFPNGTCILVGNRQHMEEHHVIFGPIVDAAMWDLEIQGKTAVCVAFNSAIVGVLGIADTIKTEAAETVAALKAMGMDVWMVTGDNKTTAAAIGDELGIPNDRIVAGALPAEKVRKVMELQEDYGRCVAMVGDGINDSPAISQANLGIAVGAGSHIAVDAADMVIVRNNLFDTVVALDLSKMVFGRIRWNLLWALLYNVMAIPVAAGVSFPLTHTILPPQYAGLCMALSSISVVVSSMALKCYKRPVGAKETTREVFPMGGSSSGYGHAGAARGSVVSRARGRLERLKKTISEKVKEMQSPDKKYARVPVGESDDLGLELGLGGLGGLPAALEYDDDDDSCFNRSL